MTEDWGGNRRELSEFTNIEGYISAPFNRDEAYRLDITFPSFDGDL